eukprot:Nk52_evm28s370 gene=Nk52_evmTU28s370
MRVVKSTGSASAARSKNEAGEPKGEGKQSFSSKQRARGKQSSSGKQSTSGKRSAVESSSSCNTKRKYNSEESLEGSCGNLHGEKSCRNSLDDCLFACGPFELTAENLKVLQTPNAWLNDEHINCYVALLNKFLLSSRKRDVHAFGSHHLDSLCEALRQGSSLRKEWKNLSNVTAEYFLEVYTEYFLESYTNTTKRTSEKTKKTISWSERCRRNLPKRNKIRLV